MKRWLVALALLIPALAQGDNIVMVGYGGGGGGGGTSHWIFSGGTNNSAPTTAGTYYFNFHGHATPDATEVNHGLVLPHGATLSDLRVKAHQDIGDASDAFEWTVMRDTSGIGSTSATTLTCTMNEAQTSCDSGGNSVAADAGDRFTMRLVVTDTPVANTRFFVSLKVTPTTSNDVWIPFHAPQSVTTGTRYHDLGGARDSSSEGVGGRIVPTAGTITGISCANSVDLSGSMTVTIDFMVAGSPQSDVACVLNDANQECSDTGSISVSAGEVVTPRSTRTNSPTTGRIACGVLFRPTTTGRYFTSNSSTAPSTTADNYTASAGGGGFSTTESRAQHPAPVDLNVKSIWAKIGTAPGAGASWAITMRESGVDSALTCTISDPAVTCNTPTDVTVESGNLFNGETDPSATAPAAAGGMITSLEIAP